MRNTIFKAKNDIVDMTLTPEMQFFMSTVQHPYKFFKSK
jgi:hypothetical protein